MLNVLRKIRNEKGLNKKFSSYLAYAIGEIILVVVGILIAVSINNWNENNKNRKIERTYLEDFRNDLRTDVETLTERIAVNSTMLSQIDSIFVFLQQKEELKPDEVSTFLTLNGGILAESFFVPEKSTIRQFEASSNGSLITNKELKDKLFRYYSISDREQNNMEKSIQLYQHEFITKDVLTSVVSKEAMMMVAGVDLGLPNLNIDRLRNNHDYLFSLVSKTLGTTGQNASYRAAIERAEELIRLIDKELEK